MKKIIFYNNFHNGDVHLSRGLVEIIVNLFPNCEYFYSHNNNKGLLKDIPHIKETDLDNHCDMEKSVSIIDDTIYINTWYGQNYRKFLHVGGTTLLTIKLILNHLLRELNKEILVSDHDLLPKVYSENIKKPSVSENFNVLICNNNALSGQAINVDLHGMIDVISDNNPNITFYVTDKLNLHKKNIIYTSDITENFPDLVEISYISTKCKIIVGRSSGPYSFSITDNNLLDEDKTFFALCNDYITGIWDKNISKCKYYHEPSNDINKITNTLQTIINTYNLQ